MQVTWSWTQTCFPDDDDEEAKFLNGITVQTDRRRRCCPEGFNWDCCDEDIEGTFCVV